MEYVAGRTAAELDMDVFVIAICRCEGEVCIVYAERTDFSTGTYDVVCCSESGAETYAFDHGVDAVVVGCGFYLCYGVDLFEVEWDAA